MFHLILCLECSSNIHFLGGGEGGLDLKVTMRWKEFVGHQICGFSFSFSPDQYKFSGEIAVCILGV